MYDPKGERASTTLVASANVSSNAIHDRTPLDWIKVRMIRSAILV